MKHLCKSLFALLLPCLAQGPAQAQTAANLADFVVRDMRVEGLQRISEGTVYNYLPVNIGDRLSRSRLDEALRAVYATGFFKDAELRRDGSTLVIVVAERPSIESFEISGNKDIETEELEDSLRGVGLATGRTFDQSVLDNVEQFLTDAYYARGKYGVRIEPTVTELEDNKVRVAIEVKEGTRARIRQINLVGNVSFSDEEILDGCEIKTRNLLSFYKQDDRYSREALSGCLEHIRSHYLDRGFADYSGESTQVAISPDMQGIFITINVREGERYRIADVKLAGDLVVPEAHLRRLILLKPGQTFSNRLLTQTSELMSQRLGQDGYAFANIEPVPAVDREAKEVAITFYIDPGNRVYVRRINFSGSTSTNDEVFRREMRQLEGAWLSNVAVDRSEQRIRRLPFVESVAVETTPVPGSADMVDVDFTIEDGLPGQFGGGLGYSGTQKLLLNANFTHTNFMGRGNRISADINSGKFTKIYALSHTNPYASPDGISRTIQFAYRDTTQFTSSSSDFSTETLTAGVEYGMPISEFSRVSAGLSWQEAQLVTSASSALQANQWTLNNGNTFIEELMDDIGNTFFISGTKFNTLEVIASWVRDSRNRALFANRGSRHRFRLGVTIPSSDVTYYTVAFDWLKYWPIKGQWVVRASTELAFGDDYGDTTDLPPFRNFFAGGPDSVRGFRESRLGPIDTNGNPYGGNLKTVAQFELLLPTPEKWRASTRASLFFDIGNVFYTGNTIFFDPSGNRTEYDFDVGELKQSVGVAVQWLAPLGVFRFSYARPLNDEERTATRFEDEIEQFQFSIGSAF